MPVQLSESIPDINIAVIGAEGVGKSTFVQKALDLPSLVSSQAMQSTISLDGNDYLVRLLELPIDDVDIDDDDNTVAWPDTIDSKIMPKIDGALTLYDVQDRGSLEDIPQMLSECLCFRAMSTIDDAISCSMRSPLIPLKELLTGICKQMRSTSLAYPHC